MTRKMEQLGLTTASFLMFGSALLFTALPKAAAADGVTAAPAPEAMPEPVYETEKSWKFDDGDNLVFFNPSPNANGLRFVRWKDYNWTVTKDLITVSDPRPYGTTLQGRRGQLDKDSKLQSDKDLMKELKNEAGDLRASREPSTGPGVYYGLDYGWWGGGWGFPHRHHFGGFRHFHHR